MKDYQTFKVLAMGKAKGNFYFLDQTRFDTSRFPVFNHYLLNQYDSNYKVSLKIVCNVVNNSNVENKGQISAQQKCSDVIHKQCKLWHCKLGYVPFDVIQNIIPSIVGKCNELSSCEVCVKAKQTRLEFLDSNTHSKKSFDVIHVDLWGPIS